MKEHRNSFKLDRGSKGTVKKFQKNGMHESVDLPHLEIEKGKKDVLSLSFRREMERNEQTTSDKKWDEIEYLCKRKYLKKIKQKDYIEIYNSVKI